MECSLSVIRYQVSFGLLEEEIRIVCFCPLCVVVYDGHSFENEVFFSVLEAIDSDGEIQIVWGQHSVEKGKARSTG